MSAGHVSRRALHACQGYQLDVLISAQVGAELDRAAQAAARLALPKPSRLPPVDVERYCAEPVSFHRMHGGPLLVAVNLARLAPDDAFCPTLDACRGGFCGNATATYAPEDFDRLAEFSRQRLRAAMPEIKRRIIAHLRDKRDAAEGWPEPSPDRDQVAV